MDASPLERFLEQLAGLDPSGLRLMVATWEMGDAGRRASAWRAAIDGLAAARRGDELSELREAVGAWSNDQAFDVMALYGGQSHEWERNQGRAAAIPPVLDAGLAAIAGDLLDEEQRSALTMPWREVMTKPGGQTRVPYRARRPGGASPPR